MSINLGKPDIELNYFNVRPFTYLGTKRLETPAIWNVIKNEATGIPFTDLFGGSGTVSSAFMPYASKIIYNEKQSLITDFLKEAIENEKAGTFDDWYDNKVMPLIPRNKEEYFALRAEFNKSCTNYLMYYVLINACTSALIRWNPHSKIFNQAFSGKVVTKPSYKRNLKEFCEEWVKYDGKWKIVSEDFSDIVPEGFIYLDPPYSNAFNSYLPEVWEDKPLIDYIEKYVDHPIAISGMQDDEDPNFDKCYVLGSLLNKGWKLHIITDHAFSRVSPHAISAKVNAKDRTKCHDVLLTNF